MESSRGLLKSLKGTLLEYAVLNAEPLFQNPEEIPVFPRDLFEEIIETGNEMCWPIRTKYLIPCIAVRDKLKWSVERCFGSLSDFRAENLKLFAGSMHTLKILRVAVFLHERTDVNVFNEILKAADALEDLDIRVVTSNKFATEHMTRSMTFSMKIKAMIEAHKHLKLKRLRLTMNMFELFPYSLDPDVLTTLNLSRCRLTKYFLEKLAGFQRLVHLSMFKPIIKNLPMGKVIESVASLRGLRSLSLWSHCIDMSVDELMLNKIMKDLTNLDLLELGRIDLYQPTRLLTPKRKLKVLNYYQCNNVSRLAVVTDKTGYIGNLGGVKTILLTTKNPYLYYFAVECLFRHLNVKNVTQEQLKELEEKGIFNSRMLDIEWRSETFYYRPCSGTSYDGILKAICCGMNFYGPDQFPFLKKWVKDFVCKGTHLAKGIKMHLGKKR